MDFKSLTETVSVAGQLSLTDLQRAKAAGFKTVVNNRPDGEAPFQPKSDTLACRAAALDMAYHYIPVSPGQMSEDNVRDFKSVLDAGHDGPVLAFCRTGTRSANLWAVSQAGLRAADDVIARGKQAGYDLSQHRAALEAAFKCA